MFDWLKSWTEWWSLVRPHQIYEAVSNKDHERLKILLIFANANAINNSNKDLDVSPLDLAATQGDEISVELLLAYGAIPNYDQRLHIWAKSTFSRAILSSNHKVIQLLLNQGLCDPDTNLEITSWQEIIVNTFPYNYWFKVVELDDVPIFQLLLEHTGRTVGNDKWSRRILITACGLGSDATVEYLLDQGVPIESTDESGWTCAFYAVGYFHINTLRLLAARGANLKHKDIRGRSLLHIAVLYYEFRSMIDVLDIIRYLYDNGLDINATDNDGLTPIRLSFSDYRRGIVLDIVYYFLSKPDINLAIPDVNGETLMHRMVDLVRPFTVQILCREDVDINVRDNLGRTPLHYYKIDDFFTLPILLGFGVDTSVLHSLSQDLLNNKDFLKILRQHRLKRSLANLSSDPNIDTILAQYQVAYLKEDIDELAEFELKVTNEIQRMKETILCEKLTFYDFLHAKKRALIKIAQKPQMYQVFVQERYDHGFINFMYMLIKNYVCGKRPLTAIESQAITDAEKNLDVLFNYRLPNLIVHNLKKYLDIEDMVILENIMKTF